ncbi:Zinc dependent phospholipase C [Hoeflea sp. IMCC20628]|uniref:hypothetical protein n=1 Tax=Hoeflea sp. IMCC20628 TaxID=1620421 RepID=UPI00063AA609|nr:hypothetical protein [Hoeflea sp. IMCC20628]AKH99415.1 Zinc dependent phospholipase C [Hoeflea sp. IMCC20628]
MNTQTHLLLATALLARPGRENRVGNAAVIAGALLPDAVIFVMFGWSKLIGAPESEVWSSWYFNPPWLTAIDWMNSLPLFSGLLLLGLLLPRGPLVLAGLSSVLTLFALAAITHLLGDLPFHVNDGHAHFVPFSQWRFVSPISYWDPRYYGNIVSVIELLLGLTLIVILWRRFQAKIIRAILALAVLTYAVPYVWFVLLGGHSEHNASAALTLIPMTQWV